MKAYFGTKITLSADLLFQFGTNGSVEAFFLHYDLFGGSFVVPQLELVAGV